MINVYIDTTGSMTEMGKDSAVLYIAKSIQDYCDFKNIQTSFYKLDNTEILKLEAINFSNDIQLNIGSIQSNSILIGDGLFEFEDQKIFDISLSIGIDSDLLSLKKVSKKVFDNDSVLSALEYLIYHNNLLDNNSKEVEEDNDEW